MAVIDYDMLFDIPPYSLERKEKRAFYQSALTALQDYHSQKCREYKKLVDTLGDNPALPVRLFKEFDLRSCDTDTVNKTMTSSGTTGQNVSKIYLDKENSARQTKTLIKIVSDFIGKSRLPMLVIDSPSVVKDRRMFSARGAGILGFTMLGRDITYALDDNMNLNWESVDQFCKKYQDQNVFIFGFTYMIWLHFYIPLMESKKKLPIKGTMIHGGGWKKLADKSVGSDEFRESIKKVTDIDNVLNYYGMVEQTGSIFMECEYGHLHASNFSDIDILNASDFSDAGFGERGIVKLTSLLPTSYPGHILLTEDEGEILGEDDCPCGRKGKYFKIFGRIKGAEIRGCSDTYERH